MLDASASAGTVEIGVTTNSPFRFVPNETTLGVGDSAHWEWQTQAGHNVRQNSKIFMSGAPSGSGDFTVTLSAGTWNYFCTTHGTTQRGMRGVLFVPVTLAAAPSGPRFTVRWANGSTETGNKYDVEFKVGADKWKPWKTKTGEASAVFGAGGNPVTAKAGEKYSMRARSRSGKVSSQWSPPISYKP